MTYDLAASAQKWIECFVKLKEVAPTSMVFEVLFNLISGEINVKREMMIQIKDSRINIYSMDETTPERTMDTLLFNLINGTKGPIQRMIIQASYHPRMLAQDIKAIHRDSLNDIVSNYVDVMNANKARKDVTYRVKDTDYVYPTIYRSNGNGRPIVGSGWRIVMIAKTTPKTVKTLEKVIRVLRNSCPWVGIGACPDDELTMLKDEVPVLVIQPPAIHASAVVILADALYSLISDEEFDALSLGAPDANDSEFLMIGSRIHRKKRYLFGLWAHWEHGMPSLQYDMHLGVTLPYLGHIDGPGWKGWCDAHPFTTWSSFQAVNIADKEILGVTWVKLVEHHQYRYMTYWHIMEEIKNLQVLKFEEVRFYTDHFQIGFRESMSEADIDRLHTYAYATDLSGIHLLDMYRKVEVSKGYMKGVLINPLD